MKLAETSKEHFLSTVKEAGVEYAYLLRHLPQVERWALSISKIKPEINTDVLMAGVWLHDIGQVVGDKATDHAVNSGVEARRFLQENGVENTLIDNVSHCVRAHRCRDVQPETLEARAVAVADSASHMTDTVYIDMSNRGELTEAKAKLERDYRDVGLLPEVREKMTPFYQAWKGLLDAWSTE
jgi:HD superfamily phosphodiesterase